ncbi:MAG: hypothetical protein JRJ77_12110 [Deltaproteobacteria bacterium]|nr:hypothetical protein [Deltaproteobacteria bacterium]
MSKKQAEILELLRNCDYWISFSEIKKSLGIGISNKECASFSRSLRRLQERGLIDRLGRQRRYRMKGKKFFEDDFPSIEDFIKEFNIKEMDVSDLKGFEYEATT